VSAVGSADGNDQQGGEEAPCKEITKHDFYKTKIFNHYLLTKFQVSV
jgi:hypothetical protein